jgi:hypothetical protein
VLRVEWKLSAETPGKGPRIRAAEVTAEERAADEWVTTSVREALPTIREIAKNWGNTVTALTALFGFGTLISGDKTVRALQLDWRITYGCLTIIALCAGAAAVVAAALAAQATITEVSPDLADRVAQRRRRIEQAIHRLRLSRWVAGVAVVAAVAATAVRWFGPV